MCISGLLRRASVASILLSLVCGTISPAIFADDQAKTVSLTVDYGDGVQKKFVAIPWKDSMTIADALEAAKGHPRGIQYKKRGSGATTLLFEIDGLANGHQEKYWLFDLNGKEGDRSYALVALEPGDAVLWRFGKYP